MLNTPAENMENSSPVVLYNNIGLFSNSEHGQKWLPGSKAVDLACKILV
jgi:hypothetical protein